MENSTSPSHYKASSLEAIDVIEAFWPDSFTMGNVLKYAIRLENKGNPTDDAGKIIWYLLRFLTEKGYELPDLGAIIEDFPEWGLDHPRDYDDSHTVRAEKIKQQRPDDDKPATGTTLWKPFPSSHAYIVYRDLEAVSQACDRNALTYNSWLVDRFGGIVMAVAELYRTDSGPYLRVPIDSSMMPSVPGEVAEEWVFLHKEELDFSKAEQ